MNTRELHLGYMYWLNGTHWGGWRLPQAPTANAFDLAYPARVARLVEQAKFDFIFLGDTLPGDIVKEHWSTTHNSGRLEPFVLASQLALRTSKLGLVVTAHPTYYEPYILARLTASLDHLSGGRLAWNVVLGASDLAAQNFSLPNLGAERRYARADEFIRAIRRLWDSIEDGAYLQDKASGRYLDPDKVHRLGFDGEHFQVAGTLSVCRPPQGQIPMLYSGMSELSRELTAAHCEMNFTGVDTIEESIAFNADVRARARRLRGRDEPIFFLPGIAPLIADTREDAVALYDQLNDLLPLSDDPIDGDLDPDFWDDDDGRRLLSDPHAAREVNNLRALSARVGVDLRPLGLEGRVTTEIAEGFTPYAERLVARIAVNTGRTIKAGTLRPLDLLYDAAYSGFPLVIGTAQSIADTLIEWFERGAAEGFNVNSPYMWEQLERFCDRVVPILQERGIFRSEYTSDTFRGHFGMTVPENSFARPLVGAGGGAA